MKSSSALRGVRVFTSAAFLWAAAVLLAEEGSPPPARGEPATDGAKPATPKLSIDEAYVREKLAGALHPTRIRFLPDGRVRLDFDFLAKDPRHAGIFTPRVSDDPRSPFRWTIRREESFAQAKGGGMERKRGGLRIAERGTALLGCWFLDDVEVEMDYVNSVSFDPRQAIAVVFQTDAGKALGSNFGTQCATYVAGSPRGPSRGKPLPAEAGDHVKLKLVVKEGTCEAHFDREPRASMPYDRAEFGSGRVGILWGPGVAGIVKKIVVTGRLDVKRMAGELRKAGGS